MRQTTTTPGTALRTRRAATLRASSARSLADLAERRSRIDAPHSVMYKREAIRLRALAAGWEHTARIQAVRTA